MNELQDMNMAILGAQDEVALLAGDLALGAGASVILVDADTAATAATYDALADNHALDSESPRLAIFALGLANAVAEDYAAMAKALDASSGGIDIVLHNQAALCPPQGLDELKPADWRLCFAAHLDSPWLAQRALLPSQRRRKEGRIIFVVDEIDEPWLGAYALSKAAQLQLMRTWTRELKPAAGGADPAVAAVSLAGVGTRARRYYYPGLGRDELAPVSSARDALWRAMAGDRLASHGEVLAVA